MKRHARLSTLAAIVFLTASYGCADHALDLTKPTVRAQASTAPPKSVNSERAALTTITRAVALALANDGFRTEALEEMRNAPFKEHKLELSKYLNPGRLSRLSSASGKSASELASAMKTVRALEFYMPVAAQRESWTGDANILVASQLEEGEEIVAFDTKGRQVGVTEAAPPSAPTLSIVPVETRFNEPVDLKKWKNINSRGGRAIGTMVSCAEFPAACESGAGNGNLEISRVIDCGACGGGAGSSYGQSGLYMTFSRLVDMGEGWLKGDPEIEVHVHGPQSGGYSQYGVDLACAGERAIGARYFDQNSSFWRGTPVLIFTEAQVNAFNSEFFDGHNILFWEDDDAACALKFDKEQIQSILNTTAGAIGGAALRFAGKGKLGVVAIFAGILVDSWSWLHSNDDYLGAVVPASANGDRWTDANYTILKARDVNGRIQLDWKF